MHRGYLEPPPPLGNADLAVAGFADAAVDEAAEEVDEAEDDPEEEEEPEDLPRA